LMQASVATDQDERRKLYVQAQQRLAEELPVIPLWYPDNVVVHSSRLTGVTLNAGGSFDFLRTAELQ
jgi:peptide/nickel transport system substrate-binding protein